MPTTSNGRSAAPPPWPGGGGRSMVFTPCWPPSSEMVRDSTMSFVCSFTGGSSFWRTSLAACVRGTIHSS